jgi:prolyl-tRNA synthetase
LRLSVKAMYLSKYFLPLIKEVPSEATVVSHQLMLRAGMIRQVAAGLYTWLPYGVSVLNKVAQIVREEMSRAGCHEVIMPCIQPLSLWEKSGRLSEEGGLGAEMLTMQDRHGNGMIFAPTAEEVISELFGDNTQSYKELPQTLYQINWKFRDEIRPRFGVMRAREFLMKDAYSFHIDQACALTTYEQMMQAYIKVFKRMQLQAIPVKADSGAIGGDYSHEFHILAETGESEIFYEQALGDFLNKGNFELADFQRFYAAEEEKHVVEECPVAPDQLCSKRGIEVAHVFYLGQKYSRVMEVMLQGKDGRNFNPHMGCYGIGISRLVAAIIEVHHDEKGIIWPEAIAPFKVIIINLSPNDTKCVEEAARLYNGLQESGVEVLLEDTEDSVGAKFNKADLIGIPHQVVIGRKLMLEGKLELRERANGAAEQVDITHALAMLQSKFVANV